MNTKQELVHTDEKPGLPASVTPMDMIDRAISSGAAPETLERLLALQERWEANQGRKAFDQAISAAKAEIPAIVKRAEVDFTTQKGRTHYRHEKMQHIAEVVDPILSKHGLSYRFRTHQEGAMVSVTCVLSHRDGYSEETTLSAGKDESGNKNSIQAVGSTTTYLQRYTLKAALGLATSDDDDGKAASKVEAPELVTEKQASTIADLMADAEVSEEKVLRNVYGRAPVEGESIHTIPASMYERVVSKLKATIRQRGQGK